MISRFIALYQNLNVTSHV